MVEGRMYLIRLHYQAGNYQWVDREMCGVYLGESNIGTQLMYAFSLRPKFGTTDVLPRDITGVFEVDRKTTAPFGPRKPR